MRRDPRDTYFGAPVTTLVGERVRDHVGCCGVIVALDPRFAAPHMVAVLFEAPALARFGPILMPRTALTFLSEGATDPVALPYTHDEVFVDD